MSRVRRGESHDLTTATLNKKEPWQAEVASAIRDIRVLMECLELPTGEDDAFHAIASFPLLVPRSYLNRMGKGDPTDPLLKQVLPQSVEIRDAPGFSADAVGDHDALRTPGLLCKYPGRALLIASRCCAVHCRYCFRRHYPYVSAPVDPDGWEPALQAIQDDTSVSEVILSGGDPLMRDDRQLQWLIARLEAVSHVRRLRVHSRLPIVIPSRVTESLVDLLTSTRLTTWMVVQSNHANELVGDCVESLRQLVTSGMTVLNQSVLLRGVNDTPEALQALCERLVDLGVVPYYLHQLDRVSGSAHFEVDVAKGLELMSVLRRMLPGYAMPRYVREVAGELFKVPVCGDDAHE